MSGSNINWDRVMGCGSSIFILVSENIDHVVDAFSDDGKDYESVWIQLRLFNAILLTIASFYIPQNSQNDSFTLIYSDIIIL